MDIIDAALALAARKPWRQVGLADIAGEAGVTLAELYGHYPGKTAILDAFSRRIDLASLDGAEAEAAERPRDRLFETLMRRFDALRPHRAAVRSVLADLPADPVGALAGAPQLLRSMTWMLEASGIEAAGWRGVLRANLLAVAYLSALRVWLDDDTVELSRTMAALDRRLRRIEGWLGLEPAPEPASP